MFPDKWRLAELPVTRSNSSVSRRASRFLWTRLEVFLPPSRPPVGAPQAGEAITRAMLAADSDLDLFSPGVHEEFFRQIYASADLDSLGIQALRSERNFEQVARAFRLIEEGAGEVVVRWGRSPEILSDVARFGPDRQRLRALQRFVVRVRRDSELAVWFPPPPRRRAD